MSRPNQFVAANALAALLTVTGGAEAATMTFPGGPLLGTTHVENGITADAGFQQIGNYERAGTAHMDDSGSEFARSISFTMNRLFSAIAFDLLPDGFEYTVCDWDGVCQRRSYDNVRVSGFRAGSRVADSAFEMGTTDLRYVFGAAFRDIDRLEIGFTNNPRSADLPAGYDAYPCSPCSHYSIDNVTLAPVPLPPAILLLAAALGLVSAVARRKTAGPVHR